MTVELATLDHLEATFTPHRTDDLRHNAQDFVGRRTVWEVLWIADEDERFAGEWVLWPLDEDERRRFGGSVPERDLTDIVLLGPQR